MTLYNPCPYYYRRGFSNPHISLIKALMLAKPHSGLSCLSSLGSRHSSLCIFHFWSSPKYFSALQKYCALSPLGLHMLFFSAWNILFFPPLLLFRFEIQSTSLNVPSLQRCLSQGLCPIASSEQGPPPLYQNCLGLCIPARLSVL